jgi:4'-phosphopantetheinyl transferase
MLTPVDIRHMKPTVIWESAPSQLHLVDHEVHVWRADLDLPAKQVSKLLSFLDNAEQGRAERFIFDRDRTRFAVARSILRLLVARYLNTSANTIEFKYGPQGKPALTPDSPLRFNLAHSDRVALYAFSLDRDLGIDVESQRRFAHLHNREIVQSHFSQKEQEEFYSLDPELQESAFYLGWTRKEAYLKARGEGLQIPLQSFDVSLDPEGPAILRSHDAAHWELHSFDPEPDFAAALVVEGANCKLRYWEWPHSSEI